MSLIKNVLISIVFIALTFIIWGCGEDCDGNQINNKPIDNSLTSLFHVLEENNRLEFRDIVVNFHSESGDSNYINKSIIELYDLIDKVTEDLLNQSGGYDPKTAELVAGNDKSTPLNVIKKHNLLSQVKSKFVDIKTYSENHNIPYSEQALNDLNAALYVIISNNWNYTSLKDFTVARLYLGLMIMQNRLLVAEVKYHEMLISKKQTSSANASQ